MRTLVAAGTLSATLVMLTGCSVQSPGWAESINPCCGQDLVLQGIDPPENRCADIVVDQRTARRLMTDVAQGNAITHWHVRFIPGGPACIWYQWPGLTEEDFLEVDPPEDVEGEVRNGDEMEAAPADTGAAGEPAASEHG
jgi:hypothetical protein